MWWSRIGGDWDLRGATSTGKTDGLGVGTHEAHKPPKKAQRPPSRISEMLIFPQLEKRRLSAHLSVIKSCGLGAKAHAFISRTPTNLVMWVNDRSCFRASFQ